MVIGSAVTAITYRVKSDRWGGSMRRFSSGNYAGSAKISFKKSGCTSRSASSWLNRPGQTSGHFSFTVQITNYKSTPGSTIDFQLIDAAGHESNISPIHDRLLELRVADARGGKAVGGYLIGRIRADRSYPSDQILLAG